MRMDDMEILQVLGSEIPRMRDASGGFVVYTGLRTKRRNEMARQILIADDQPSVRHALYLLLEQELAPETIDEAAAGEALLAQVACGCPDLVLLDWGLPGMAAAELLGALRQTCAALTIVVLSGRPEAEEEALRAGADSFVSKADPPERLLAAIRDMDEPERTAKSAP
jgi:DNA-binding NarL/FixJ family response regulator